MLYEPKDFSALLGTPGFSEQLLNNHFTLYQGYVKNVNTLFEKVGTAEAGTPEYSELKRRFGWEWNGMRLHELYFGNMTKDAVTLSDDSPLRQKMAASFNSGEACEKNFRDTAALRGIGWVVLYYDTAAGHLFNVWVSDHAENHLAGCTPLLVMDMWEHAYTLDYGIKKADYVDAFVKAIDWNAVAGRLQ